MSTALKTTITDARQLGRAVEATRGRPWSPETLRIELDRQLPFQPIPIDDGLDDLASILAKWLSGVHDLDAVPWLAEPFPSQPLVQLYAFAMYREAGDLQQASRYLERLRSLDPEDPIAAQLAAQAAGETVEAMSEQTRLTNIAKLAETPLLRNPYELAVGAIFEVIRDRVAARVLDIGVGSGAQLAELLGLLRKHDHRLRRLELVGLDLSEEFLERAGDRIAATPVPPRTEVVYEPVKGRIEDLDERQIRRIAGDSGVHAANATITLHEVGGERKLAALRNLRLIAPAHLFIAEWNYCLETTLSETSLEFLLNVRSAAAGFVSALTERYSHREARSVVHDWLSQDGGQLICPASRRQECFLPVQAWQALIEYARFSVAPVQASWLAYAPHRDHATIDGEATWIATSRYRGWPPIALFHAVPA